jgi:hypothetical protein
MCLAGLRGRMTQLGDITGLPNKGGSVARILVPRASKVTLHESPLDFLRRTYLCWADVEESDMDTILFSLFPSRSSLYQG